MSILDDKNPALFPRRGEHPGAPIQVGLGLILFVAVIVALMAFRAPRADAAPGIETVSDPFIESLSDASAAMLPLRHVPLR